MKVTDVHILFRYSLKKFQNLIANNLDLRGAIKQHTLTCVRQWCKILNVNKSHNMLFFARILKAYLTEKLDLCIKLESR